MIIKYPGNCPNDVIYEYHRTHGGHNYFMCYYKNASVGRVDPLEAWRFLGKGKNTVSGKELKAWCLEMHEKHGNEQKPEQMLPS